LADEYLFREGVMNVINLRAICEVGLLEWLLRMGKRVGRIFVLFQKYLGQRFLAIGLSLMINQEKFVLTIANMTKFNIEMIFYC